jgi:hypothetical protein
MEGYEAKEVLCEYDICTGDVELAGELMVSDQTLLEFLAAAFPKIRDRIDVVSEIRLTIKVREK